MQRWGQKKLSGHTKMTSINHESFDITMMEANNMLPHQSNSINEELISEFEEENEEFKNIIN